MLTHSWKWKTAVSCVHSFPPVLIRKSLCHLSVNMFRCWAFVQMTLIFLREVVIGHLVSSLTRVLLAGSVTFWGRSALGRFTAVLYSFHFQLTDLTGLQGIRPLTCVSITFVLLSSFCHDTDTLNLYIEYRKYIYKPIIYIIRTADLHLTNYVTFITNHLCQWWFDEKTPVEVQIRNLLWGDSAKHCTDTVMFWTKC